MQNLLDMPLNQLLLPLAGRAARIVIALIAALAASRIARRVVANLSARLAAAIEPQDTGAALEREKRAATLGGFVGRALVIAIWTVAIIMSLQEAGFDIGPILAGAGVIGLAVGFGAQTLVKDIIAGLFILVENQIRVNDIAVINGTGGLVQEINLRTTVLRDLEGVVHVFPNGQITSLSNRTREFSYYVFDLGVAYKEDTDRVVEVVRGVAAELMQDAEFGPLILEPLDVLGVDRFADSAVVIKMRIKTQPGRQYPVGREMNRRIKKKFDEAGIEIPFPHQSVYFGEASKPFRLQLDGASREELKQIVREVLAEVRQSG